MSETVNQENAIKETDTKTFTQDEVNGIVNDRLARERKKYEGIDLDALKKKAAKFDEMEEASKTELEKANEKVKALQYELESIRKEKELSAMREQIANEIGIPVNLLTGDSEEECRTQAEAIKAYANPNGYPTIRDGGDPQNMNNKRSNRDAFTEWAQKAFD